MTPEAPILHMIYRNHRGETRYRRIFPARLWHGSTEWHPQPQFFIHGLDVDGHQVRDFALADVIYSWPGEPNTPRPSNAALAVKVISRATTLGEWAEALAADGIEVTRLEPVEFQIHPAARALDDVGFDTRRTMSRAEVANLFPTEDLPLEGL